MNKKILLDMLMLTLLFISVFIIIFIIYWLIWRGNQRIINQLTRPIQEEYIGQDKELVLSRNRYHFLKRNREFIVIHPQPQRAATERCSC